jgi:hypothetical protein
LVSVLVTVTAAATTGAPLGSTTRPKMELRVSWPGRASARRKSILKQVPVLRTFHLDCGVFILTLMIRIDSAAVKRSPFVVFS